MTRVLVTGGTGVLGREVVSRLLEKGDTVRIMSRSPQRGTINVEWAQAQMLTGEGLSEALQGVDVIVHAAADRNFAKTDVEMTRLLLEKAKAAGVGISCTSRLSPLTSYPPRLLGPNSLVRHWCVTVVFRTSLCVSPNFTN